MEFQSPITRGRVVSKCKIVQEDTAVRNGMAMRGIIELMYQTPMQDERKQGRVELVETELQEDTKTSERSKNAWSKILEGSTTTDFSPLN